MLIYGSKFKIPFGPEAQELFQPLENWPLTAKQMAQWSYRLYSKI